MTVSLQEMYTLCQLPKSLRPASELHCLAFAIEMLKGLKFDLNMLLLFNQIQFKIKQAGAELGQAQPKLGLS